MARKTKSNDPGQILTDLAQNDSGNVSNLAEPKETIPLQEKLKDKKLDRMIEKNIPILEEVFKDCSDVVFRNFIVDNRKAYLICIDGLIDSNSISRFAVIRLLNDSNNNISSYKTLEDKVISSTQITETDLIYEVIGHILDGNTAILIDRMDHAIILDAKGGNQRGIAEPETESVIRGPHEGFVENFRTNTSMLRRKLRTANLKIVPMKLGEETRTQIGIVYLQDIASPKLIDEVTKRLKGIKIDGILETGYIEELIQDDTKTVFPLIQYTERPDTVVANLLEGRVVILVDGTPFALIMPVSFWQFIQAADDYYERFQIAIFLRLLRSFSLLIALLLPSLYIAVISFHQEMLPTSLMLSVAAAREAIPFPVVVEAFIMEMSFEALREAGVRLPKTVGQAVSILGALVVGQAAVMAGIVSAPMVIIVSMTGIASFTIPRYNASISIRLLRFPLMILAGTFGIFGIVIGVMLIITHLCKLRSFGVPYLAPVAPLTLSELKDVFIRTPWWKMDSRPKSFIGRNPIRMGDHQMPENREGNEE